MDGLARLATLWRPHPSLADGASQRRARLAAGILLVLLVALAAAFLFPDEGSAAVLSGHRLTALAWFALLGSYLLVRSGRVVAGVVGAVAVVDAALAFGVANADTHETALLVLGMYVVPIAVAGVLLPVRSAAMACGATVVLAIVLEGQAEGDLSTAPDQHALALALQLTAMAGLALVAARIVQQQARELEASQAMLREVTDNVPEVLFIVSGDGRRALYTSPAYETLVGRSVQQSLADPLDWVQAVHPDDRDRVLASLGVTGDDGLEYRLLHPTRGLRHFRARTYPLRDRGGQVTRMLGIAEDITEAKQAQEQLREEQRKRIHLLQQLAHDLASPLSPVKIQLRILQDRVAPEGQKALAIVQRNVEHVQRLVEDVKDVARLEGGALKLERKSADLVALARAAVDTVGPAAAERQVRVALDAPGELPAHVDPGRVTQVLYNLVGNALKFTPPGGEVVVRLARMDGHARVDVRDTGAGMRPDQVAKLFQPFVQVHDVGAVKRPEDKGSGLGLYICKGIVEAHGGTIAAVSDGPGRGSTFTFQLPLAAPADGRV